MVLPSGIVVAGGGPAHAQQSATVQRAANGGPGYDCVAAQVCEDPRAAGILVPILVQLHAGYGGPEAEAMRAERHDDVVADAEPVGDGSAWTRRRGTYRRQERAVGAEVHIGQAGSRLQRGSGDAAVRRPRIQPHEPEAGLVEQSGRKCMPLFDGEVLVVLVVNFRVSGDRGIHVRDNLIGALPSVATEYAIVRPYSVVQAADNIVLVADLEIMRAEQTGVRRKRDSAYIGALGPALGQRIQAEYALCHRIHRPVRAYPLATGVLRNAGTPRIDRANRSARSRARSRPNPAAGPRS